MMTTPKDHERQTSFDLKIENQSINLQFRAMLSTKRSRWLFAVLIGILLWMFPNLAEYVKIIVSLL